MHRYIRTPDGRSEWRRLTEVWSLDRDEQRNERAGRRDRNLILLWNSSDDSKACSLSFSISAFAHSSLSLSNFLHPALLLSCYLLTPLSLSLPSVCTLFLPRFFFVSQLFQLLSLSISLYRWTWMQNTVCWVHLGYQQSGEELISLLLCRVIPSPESQHFAPLFQLTSKQHQGHTQYHFV